MSALPAAVVIRRAFANEAISLLQTLVEGDPQVKFEARKRARFVLGKLRTASTGGRPLEIPAKDVLQINARLAQGEPLGAVAKGAGLTTSQVLEYLTRSPCTTRIFASHKAS